MIKYQVIAGTKTDHEVVSVSENLYVARLDAVRLNRQATVPEYRVLAVDSEGTKWYEYEPKEEK